MFEKMIGKYVVVRCTGAGVHAGVLASATDGACVLTEARRLWYWKCLPGPGGDFLSGVTVAGLHIDSKVGAPVPRVALSGVCEIAQCTDVAELSIRAQAVKHA